MTNLTITRRGSFTVETIGPNHCGTSKSLDLRYEFTARCGVDNLDSRGFLFDQTRIQYYFDRQERVSESCEQFAVATARELFRQIRNENPKCVPEYLKLTLSPSPYMAELTFEWSK